MTNHLVPERRARPWPPEEAALFQSPAAVDSCPGRLLARVRGRAARPPTALSRCWGTALGRCSWGWWEAGSAGFGPRRCSSLVPTDCHFSCPAGGTRLQMQKQKENIESLKRSGKISEYDSNWRRVSHYFWPSRKNRIAAKAVDYKSQNPLLLFEQVSQDWTFIEEDY